MDLVQLDGKISSDSSLEKPEITSLDTLMRYKQSSRQCSVSSAGNEQWQVPSCYCGLRLRLWWYGHVESLAG